MRRKSGVKRANLTRFTLLEPLWIAWCDFIRVLIRMLGVGTRAQPLTTFVAGHADRSSKGWWRRSVPGDLVIASITRGGDG